MNFSRTYDFDALNNCQRISAFSKNTVLKYFDIQIWYFKLKSSPSLHWAIPFSLYQSVKSKGISIYPYSREAPWWRRSVLIWSPVPAFHNADNLSELSVPRGSNFNNNPEYRAWNEKKMQRIVMFKKYRVTTQDFFKKKEKQKVIFLWDIRKFVVSRVA